jgi:DUF1365 family protein
MFYLDLDELPEVDQSIKFLSVNKGNIFSFMHKDHTTDYGGKTVKDNILAYLKTQQVEKRVKRIMLLTHLTTFGYIFNPVSFYYCFDEKDEPVCAVVEITNTFREMKLFYLGPDTLCDGKFVSEQMKYFYISPFVPLVHIDDLGDNKKFLYTSLTGKRLELNNANVLWMGFKYPFITLRVIFFIHFHAAILHFFKKVPYYPKKQNPELQKEVQRAIH